MIIHQQCCYATMWGSGVDSRPNSPLYHLEQPAHRSTLAFCCFHQQVTSAGLRLPSTPHWHKKPAPAAGRLNCLCCLRIGSWAGVSFAWSPRTLQSYGCFSGLSHCASGYICGECVLQVLPIACLLVSSHDWLTSFTL